MIGLIFLLVFAVYVGVAWFIVKALSSKKAKYTVIAIFALIPTWDVVPEQIYFRYLCATKGEIKIYKTVVEVEGFESRDPSIVRNALMKYGYRFVEVILPTGEYVRYKLDANGELVMENIERSISKYSVKTEQHFLAWGIKKTEYVVLEHNKKNEVLAVSTQFYFPGNWIQKITSPLLGGGEACPAFPQKSYEDFIFGTLKPVKSPNK